MTELSPSRLRKRWARVRYVTPIVLRGFVGRVADHVEADLAIALGLFAVKRRRRITRRQWRRPHEGMEWFTSEESAIVAALASLIVPSDDLGPGATEADVVRALDRLVLASAPRRSLYASGLMAFNDWALRAHAQPFAEVPPDQQSALLQSMDHVYEDWARPRSAAGKIARKITIAYRKSKNPAFEFYPLLRTDVLSAFYTSPVGWRWLSYDGPPMPEGYVHLRERGL